MYTINEIGINTDITQFNLLVKSKIRTQINKLDQVVLTLP